MTVSVTKLVTKLGLMYLLEEFGLQFDKIYFDIRVSHPNYLSNRTKTLQEVYEMNENERKDEYLESLKCGEGNLHPGCISHIWRYV